MRTKERNFGSRSLPTPTADGVLAALAALRDQTINHVPRRGAIRYCQIATTLRHRAVLASAQLRYAVNETMNECLCDRDEEVRRRARQVLSALREFKPPAEVALSADLELRRQYLTTYVAASPEERGKLLAYSSSVLGNAIADAVQGTRFADFGAHCLKDLRQRGRSEDQCLAFFSWMGHLSDDEAYMLAYLCTYPTETGTITALRGITEQLEELMRDQKSRARRGG